MSLREDSKDAETTKPVESDYQAGKDTTCQVVVLARNIFQSEPDAERPKQYDRLK